MGGGGGGGAKSNDGEKDSLSSIFYSSERTYQSLKFSVTVFLVPDRGMKPAMGAGPRPNKKKHDVWDPMPELNVISPYVHSRVDSQHISHGQLFARVDFVPHSGTLDWPIYNPTP